MIMAILCWDIQIIWKTLITCFMKLCYRLLMKILLLLYSVFVSTCWTTLWDLTEHCSHLFLVGHVNSLYVIIISTSAEAGSRYLDKDKRISQMNKCSTTNNQILISWYLQLSTWLWIFNIKPSFAVHNHYQYL